MTTPLARFFHWEAAGSVALVGAAATAMIWANSRWSETYFHLSHLPIAVSVGGAAFELSLQHWINDLLMAVLFFVIGLEIKRELIVGELSSVRKAALPVVAAVGGIVVPAGIYAAINAGGPGASGWGVPMATDIAFAIGILTIFGKRTPIGLKAFLAALVIADDLGAVLVIAFFYTETIRLQPLMVSAAVLLLLGIAVRWGLTRIGIFMAMALAIWAAVTASNLHPTVTGVLVAMVIPVRPKEGAPEGAQSMGQVLEDYLHPTVAFGILPLFALANAGVVLQPGAGSALFRPIGLGIVLGLVIGKQVGVLLASWLAVKIGWAALPAAVTWGQIYGAACLAGVGFTMSIFITDLAFADAGMIAEAKIAILAASVVAAAWAAIVLQAKLPRVAASPS